jgi:transcriptional regulator NrdR family protein
MLTNAIHRSLKCIKCAKRVKIVNTLHDRQNAEYVVKKNKKQYTFDKFECDYIS